MQRCPPPAGQADFDAAPRHKIRGTLPWGTVRNLGHGTVRKWVAEGGDFGRELMITAALAGPNFPVLSAWGKFVDGSGARGTVIDTEYAGQPLADCLAPFHSDDSACLARRVAAQLLSALNRAQRGLRFTHYDLHRGNVLVEYAPRGPVATIVDFGLSRATLRGGQCLEPVGGRLNGAYAPCIDCYDLAEALPPASRDWRGRDRADYDSLRSALRSCGSPKRLIKSHPFLCGDYIELDDVF